MTTEIATSVAPLEEASAHSQKPASSGLDDIDVFSPDRYLGGVPYDDFRRLRALAPVFFQKERRGRGYWAVTKYADVVKISRDPLTFSSYRGCTFIDDHSEESEELTTMRLLMLNMDPPQHVRYRNIVRHGFIPKAIAAQEERIRARVNYILDRAAARSKRGDDIEFVHDVAAQLPIEVIADMIGVPQDEREMVFDWSTRMLLSIEPTETVNQELIDDGKAAAMNVLQYAGEMAQKRFAEPQDDLLTVLVHGMEDGKLEPMEFAMFFMLLIVAGYETTRNAISSGMYQLIQHPQAWADLKANHQSDPTLLASAVEEMVRFDPPITYFRRTAMKDVEVRGVKIHEGDKIVLYYPSANRDEEVFENADVFDIRRKPNDHLSFGIGQHVCLGNTLARTEIRIFFEELIRRADQVRLVGETTRWRSNFVNGLRQMPVRIELARAAAQSLG